MRVSLIAIGLRIDGYLVGEITAVVVDHDDENPPATPKET